MGRSRRFGGIGRAFLQAALLADMHGRVSAVEWDLWILWNRLASHGPRVLSGGSPRHREGLGGRPRDGKTAFCGAARGKGSCLDLRYPNQWAAEERGSAGPLPRAVDPLAHPQATRRRAPP
ncbi:hypothetical protein TcG_00228 [Trypanosoma cruzi]|nr:hypothetical protein TcG_00228 [Trypanosoma cruzi]